MQDNILGIAILFFLLIVANKLLALPQIRKLNNQLLVLKQSGPVSSVGLYRHWSGNKVYVLITEKDGTIIKGYKMGGITVLAKFVEDESLMEKNYQEILENLGNKAKLSKEEQAKLMAAEYLRDGFKRLEKKKELEEEKQKEKEETELKAMNPAEQNAF